MRSFSDFNPLVLFIYFICAAGFAMFCMNPVVILLCLSGALTLFALICKKGKSKSRLYFILMFFVMALINPLFYHNGKTVLLVINNSPITLEATVYGVFASASVISVIYLFISFSTVMTSDKLYYLFGKVSNKLASVFSMTLRFIPLFTGQFKKVSQAQRALGLFKNDNVIDSAVAYARVFSITSTWALENGIITAESMDARGYGTRRRSFFSEFRFYKSDISFLVVTAVLSGIILSGLITGALDFEFYPALGKIPALPLSIASYISYGILILLPSAIEVRENIKWKYLQSKI